MKIDNKAIITFDESSIKELVKEKVNSEGYEVLDIKVNLKRKQWTEGHGLGEIDYDELVLEDIKVEAKKR